MVNLFEKPLSAEQKEKMNYLGQAVFGFGKNLEPIIKWFESENPALNQNDVLILANPGQKDEILRITIGIYKEISRPLEIIGIGKTLPLDLSNPEDRKKKFIFDVYKLEKIK